MCPTHVLTSSGCFFFFSNPPPVEGDLTFLCHLSCLFVFVFPPFFLFFDLQIPKSVRLAEELQGKQASDENHHESLTDSESQWAAKQSIGERLDFSKPYDDKRKKNKKNILLLFD